MGLLQRARLYRNNSGNAPDQSRPASGTGIAGTWRSAKMEELILSDDPGNQDSRMKTGSGSASANADDKNRKD